MKRRLIVASLVAAGLGAVLAAPAVAEPGDRHKVCVIHRSLLPDGFCVVWDDPATAQD